jgi:PIN domain nuclease of toxin-antitoxin system
VSKYVLDASALLALLNAEEGAEAVQQFLPDAVISTVNFAEVVSRLSAVGMPENEIREVLSILALEIIPFDEKQAFHAGLLYPQTKALGLSLGDRACLALARTAGVPAITADQVWKKLEIGARVKLIR